MIDKMAFYAKLEEKLVEKREQVHPSVRRYVDYQPLSTQLPYETGFGFVLTEVTTFCKHCGRPATRLRGIIKEWPQCLEVDGGGICVDCQLVTYMNYHALCRQWQH